MLRLDRRTRGTLIDVEVRRECAHNSVDVPFYQCHDKVEIAGHARLAVRLGTTKQDRLPQNSRKLMVCLAGNRPDRKDQKVGTDPPFLAMPPSSQAIAQPGKLSTGDAVKRWICCGIAQATQVAHEILVTYREGVLSQRCVTASENTLVANSRDHARCRL